MSLDIGSVSIISGHFAGQDTLDSGSRSNEFTGSAKVFSYNVHLNPISVSYVLFTRVLVTTRSQVSSTSSFHHPRGHERDGLARIALGHQMPSLLLSAKWIRVQCQVSVLEVPSTTHEWNYHSSSSFPTERNEQESVCSEIFTGTESKSIITCIGFHIKDLTTGAVLMWQRRKELSQGKGEREKDWRSGAIARGVGFNKRGQEEPNGACGVPWHDDVNKLQFASFVCRVQDERL
ncbi:hypothetical protein KQX54_002391 [Cotesia glomerata]|uniref:Uncharacterized protein n=1 Tax=Cotesia glomerata TaxID=32391 RepID=A0AAV7I3J7_COTGL|nr:hypothetical protein KQX54_002391 [Cotesia glomerata]